MTANEDPTVDVLAVGPHPDDVEIGCGGTLAALSGRGHRVGILHLTRGEAGTRGTPEERIAEAEEAARVLGAVSLDVLDCGDGGLRVDRASEDALIERLRLRRPRLVLAPGACDRHPDHERAHRLTRDACYYAGLIRRVVAGGGEPHRPGQLLFYALHWPVEPSIIVDVSDVWDTRQQALDAYRTQLWAAAHSGDDQAGGDGRPPTRVGGQLFRESIAARARACGQRIGVGYGESFETLTPLPIDDLLSLVPQGLP